MATQPVCFGARSRTVPRGASSGTPRTVTASAGQSCDGIRLHDEEASADAHFST